MDAATYADYSESIRFALLSQWSDDGLVEIVLNLYRGSQPVLSSTIARLEQEQTRSVLLQCHRHLERLGAHAIGHFSFDAPSRLDPAGHPAMAASEWIFQAC
jgi:hypothetical protein